MAGADSSSAPSDPYAVNKANLRDTIKWLAGIFGSLAAVVIAGTPISGIGPLFGTSRFYVAALALLLAFACICACLVICLYLLRSDLLYFSDIDPAVGLETRSDPAEIDWLRRDIEAHKLDLFPDFDDMASLIEKTDEVGGAVEKAGERWKAQLVSKPVDDKAIAWTRSIYDDQRAVLSDYQSVQSDVLAYASYQRFYRRLVEAAPWVLGLGIAALLLLVVFSAAVQTKKDESKPTIVVAPIATALMPASPASTPDARAYVPSGVVQFSAGTTLSASDAAVVESIRRTMMSNPSTVVFLATSSQASADATEAARLAREREDVVSALLTAQGSVVKSRILTAELAAMAPQSAASATQAQRAHQSVNLYLVQSQP